MKILLVEDDTAFAEVLTAELIDLDHDVSHRETGRAALAALNQDRFDAVVLDCMLPGSFITLFFQIPDLPYLALGKHLLEPLHVGVGKRAFACFVVAAAIRRRRPGGAGKPGAVAGGPRLAFRA